MKAENKFKWMVLAIVVLALMNLATLVTVVYHKNQAGSIENLTMQDPSISENASVQFSGRYFRDALNLNDEQMNRFSEFNPGFRKEVRTINLELSDKRLKMLYEMAKSDYDTTRLNMLSDSIGYLHANLKKETYKYYMNFKKMCDISQQQKLEQLFEEMFAGDVQTGQNGNGGQGGRRFGRQSDSSVIN